MCTEVVWSHMPMFLATGSANLGWPSILQSLLGSPNPPTQLLPTP